MSKPVAGDTIESRFPLLMRGIRRPFVVDFISSSEEAFGVVVPMPTEPVEGKIFCALVLLISKMHETVTSVVTQEENLFLFIQTIFGFLKKGFEVMFLLC